MKVPGADDSPRRDFLCIALVSPLAFFEVQGTVSPAEVEGE